MRKCSALLAVVLVAMGAVACKRATRPIVPKHPVPPGSVMIFFNRKISGPVELSIDGTRIPVVQTVKKPRNLVIAGLTVGKHRYFLSSPKDAFGPDQGELEVSAEKGVFIVAFAQGYRAVLYGTADTLPPAPGLPGVTARLVP